MNGDNGPPDEEEGIAEVIPFPKNGQGSDQEDYHAALQHQTPGAAADELGLIANSMLKHISSNHPYREGEARRWARKILQVRRDGEAAGIGDQEAHAAVLDIITTLSDTHWARGYEETEREAGQNKPLVKASRKQRIEALLAKATKEAFIPPSDDDNDAPIMVIKVHRIDAIDARLGRIERALRMRRRVRR